MKPITEFIKHHYRHFNSAALVDAAEAYNKLLADGGKMFVTIAGAMSTAELGLSLAEMIRQDKIHGICCTGANLEEDIFNLVAHDNYVRLPNYRHLSSEEEVALADQGLNRVTDTCIPEDEAIRKIEKEVLELWKAADQAGESYFPYEFMYQLINKKMIEKHYQIDPKDSWLIAAAEKNIPIWTPGWEDSTLGNIFVAAVIANKISNFQVIKSGLEAMESLVRWYQETDSRAPIGFFQIAGGISGDFPIC